MSNLPLPIRPGANTTVPFGLPIGIDAAAIPLHQGVPSLTEAIDLWVGGGGQAGQITLSFTGTAATIVVDLPTGSELPARVLDGVPFRGLTITGTGSAGNTGIAFGNVARNSARRPFQPVRSSAPTGAPVNLAGLGKPVTLHSFEPNYTDELHLWVHNPTMGPLSDLVLGVNGGPVPFCVSPTINAFSTVKLLDGVTVRGDSAVASTLLAAGDANHVVFGYFVRY